MKSAANTLKNWLITYRSRLTHSLSGGDFFLLLTVMAMVLFGLLMVYSASFIFAQERAGDGFVFIKKQVFFGCLGLMGLLISSSIDYRNWAKWSFWFLGGATLLLLLVMIPGVGVAAGGAQRWLNLGFFHVQPGEIFKFVAVIFVAHRLVQKKDRLDHFSASILSSFIFILPAIAFLLMEPDFGTSAITMLALFVLMFIGGVKKRYLGLICLTGGVIASILVFTSPYRMARLVAFSDPWKDPTGKGFQILQSLVGISVGQFGGVGLGNGKGKLFFLPEAHNDFIFAVIGEELGFIGVAIVVFAFLYFIYRGLKIGWNSLVSYNDLFGYYLATGITLVIGIQAFVNMAVVLGLLPTKGLALPFISYGGSALLVNLFAVGILMSISRGPQRVGSRLFNE